MSQDKTAQTNNDERVKELEALLEAKEQELAGSRRLQDFLVEKMLDIGVELRNMQAKGFDLRLESLTQVMQC
jgi:hypothetical protein